MISEKVNKVLNNDITFEYISKNFDTLYEGMGEINLKFEYVFSRPAGIALLSTLVNYTNRLEGRINIVHDDNKDIQYLQRADFFKNLDYEIEEDFKRHHVSRNMMECKKISADGDPDFIDDRLKAILKSHLYDKENLILGILLTTYEVSDNILEHSSGGEFKTTKRSTSLPGFVSAQYYGRQENNIEIGISDSGIGIINSLEETYPTLDREGVFKKAFELNTSRHRKLMPSRGNGLAKLKEFVLGSKGTIICRSNEFKITFNEIFPNGRIEKQNDIIGTHFKIIIGCQEDIDTKLIFNADYKDYEDDSLDDFFD